MMGGTGILSAVGDSLACLGSAGDTSDYTGGRLGAYKDIFGMSELDNHEFKDRVADATTKTCLRLCVDHALPNLSGPGSSVIGVGRQVSG